MNSREVLGANLSALMATKSAKQKSLNSNKKVGDKLKISDNTVGRIRRGENSIGVDMVDLIASLFGMSPWQLLVPELNPSNPPMLRGMGATEKELYKRLDAAMKALDELNDRARKD